MKIDNLFRNFEILKAKSFSHGLLLFSYCNILDYTRWTVKKLDHVIEFNINDAHADTDKSNCS